MRQVRPDLLLAGPNLTYGLTNSKLDYRLQGQPDFELNEFDSMSDQLSNKKGERMSMGQVKVRVKVTKYEKVNPSVQFSLVSKTPSLFSFLSWSLQHNAPFGKYGNNIRETVVHYWVGTLKVWDRPKSSCRRGKSCRKFALATSESLLLGESGIGGGGDVYELPLRGEDI
ncbi:hypothetical protein K2173_005507 [Erythroxylum novogranatense]|uniref:Uncharacterized protein n=1 Tax=Erythroxylum novogranatense TaxID=1862640 RepID=A0AAV8SKN1_9ROSI|nr:hypothetical protein K2173_005507 [Erythroxylum novogranatense]